MIVIVVILEQVGEHILLLLDWSPWAVVVEIPIASSCMWLV